MFRQGGITSFRFYQGNCTFLEAILRYNEDDCWATCHIKDWLTNFIQG
jgi:predicted RecB family nuclease